MKWLKYFFAGLETIYYNRMLNVNQWICTSRQYLRLLSTNRILAPHIIFDGLQHGTVGLRFLLFFHQGSFGFNYFGWFLYVVLLMSWSIVFYFVVLPENFYEIVLTYTDASIWDEFWIDQDWYFWNHRANTMPTNLHHFYN